MKTRSILKNILKATALFTFAVFISSCKKNDVDDSGSANIKVINASPTSTAQSFYLANQAVVSGGLDFGESTDYIVTNSGNKLDAQFRIDGTATAYATGNFGIDKNRSYSVFLAGDGQNARVKLYIDDLTAPASGQANVRFIHLSDIAPANIDIRNAAGNNLTANLAHDAASGFVGIAPGVLSLQVYAAGGTTSLGTFDLTAFTAGKIYTVYVTGSTAGSITVRQIVHN